MRVQTGRLSMCGKETRTFSVGNLGIDWTENCYHVERTANEFKTYKTANQELLFTCDPHSQRFTVNGTLKDPCKRSALLNNALSHDNSKFSLWQPLLFKQSVSLSYRKSN